VRLTRIKDFDESLSPAVLARLAGLTPGLSTRLGAALRHSGAELALIRTSRKLVLVLTDGEPSDIDVPDPHELVEDARRAARGLRQSGVDTFGIVMDPQNAGSAATIFGRHNAMPVTRLADLPAKLSAVYFRLAQR
jgi:nitric oxide reductase activation protein